MKSARLDSIFQLAILPPVLTLIDQPLDLKCTLKQYQKHAVNWMLQRELQPQEFNKITINGGILACEMGLGKTIQLLSLFLLNSVKHTLIICPTAIINQWLKESHTHAPSLNIQIYDPKIHIDIDDLECILLTTYSVIQKNIYRARVAPDRNLRHSKKYKRPTCFVFYILPSLRLENGTE